MASWMVHLRTAGKLLARIPGLSEREFIVGNIAPDSGVPNADWTAFLPPTTVSHFKTDFKNANPDSFADKYWTEDNRNAYNRREYSFFLGYLTHLITDVLWVRDIYASAKVKFADFYTADKHSFVQAVKGDWYDLDFKYLRDHPDFPAFRIYREAVGFENEFMEEFSPDAFDNRRQYITGWYLEGKENLDREYPYLTEAEMDAFVDGTAEEILDILHTKYAVNL